MKKILSLLLIVVMAGLSSYAATKYNINVGGVEVTSDNYNNVTGGDIEGSVKYDPSSKTLTLTNVSIVRENSGDYAVHNRDCHGLIVKFVGTCNLVSKKARSIRFDKTGTLVATSGSYVTVRGYNDGAIYVHNNSVIQIKGPGYFYIVSSSKAAIQGADQDGVFFMDNVVADVYSPESALYNIYDVSCYSSCKVTLKATGYSSYPVVRDVDNMYFYGGVKILAPYGAYYSDSYNSIFLDGYEVYNKDIYISDDYALLINSTNFPDGAFRRFLLSRYPKGYFTQSELNNVTSLSCYNEGISSLKGIELFPALKELRCYRNNLASLDVSKNSNLTYLDCDDNGMSSLNVSGLTKLTYLDCGPNKLPEIIGLYDCKALQTLKCNDNQLTYINQNNYPSLSYLDCSNNVYLTYISCGNDKLITLNITGNTAVTHLYCENNPDLTSITGLSSCKAMKFLSCYNCALTNLNEVSSMNNLEELRCHGNKLNYLEVTNKSKLTFLNCSNSSELQTVYAYNNPLLSSFVCNNCPELTSLVCYNDALTTLDVVNNKKLIGLSCYNNTNLYSISGLSTCAALRVLECYNCALTTLYGFVGMTSLQKLSCYNNKLTSLTVTGIKSLSELYCYNNPQLTKLKVSDCYLAKLDCSNCPALTTLECDRNSLGMLFDVTGNTALAYLDCSRCSSLAKITGLGTCTALKTLYCHNCSLTSLSALNSLNNLEELSCYDNQLTSLTLSGKQKLTKLNCLYNPKMTELTVYGNPKLKTLDCSNCAALVKLYCYSNQLTTLNVVGCSSLALVSCYSNQLYGASMTALVNGLPTRTASSPGTFYAIYTNADGNQLTDEQIITAYNKFWQPKQFVNSSWINVNLTGDINGDYEVTIADINALIEAILVGNTSLVNDVNNDGEVSVADVNALIDLILY